MPGMSDALATATLNMIGGSASFLPTFGSNTGRFLALFTAAPTSDAGTGGTEVSGPGYARVQFTSQMTANGAWLLGATTITVTSVSPWVLTAGSTPGLGVSLYVASGAGIGTLIGQVQSIAGLVVTLQAGAAVASQTGSDPVQFSAFGPPTASSGPEPATTPAFVTNSAQINFGAVGAGGWGTVVAWAIYDSVGNMKYWDYLGSQPWLPATCTAASPTLFTVPAHGFAVNTFFAVSAKVGGNFPTFSSAGGVTGAALQIVAPVTNQFTATNAGVTVVSTASGDLMLRGISPQLVPPNSTPVQFPAGGLALYAA